MLASVIYRIPVGLNNCKFCLTRPYLPVVTLRTVVEDRSTLVHAAKLNFAEPHLLVTALFAFLINGCPGLHVLGSKLLNMRSFVPQC